MWPEPARMIMYSVLIRQASASRAALVCAGAVPRRRPSSASGTWRSAKRVSVQRHRPVGLRGPPRRVLSHLEHEPVDAADLEGVVGRHRADQALADERVDL